MSQTDSINNLTIAVVFFAFNRADKLSNTIKSYLACTDAQEKDISIYIDGPRNEIDTKAVHECFVVASQLLPQAQIIQRSANVGLKESIYSGISEVLNKYDAIIVIEDDLKLEPGFYNFMKTALVRYNSNSAIYQISGYNYNPLQGTDAFFLPITTSWGWATWSLKWQPFSLDKNYSYLISCRKNKYRYDLDGSFDFSRMLKLELAGEISSWAIRWYSYVYSNDGLTLYPPQSLVINDGFNDSGTHSHHTSNALFGSSYRLPLDSITYPREITQSKMQKKMLKQHFKSGFIKKIIGYIKSQLKRVFYGKSA